MKEREKVALQIEDARIRMIERDIVGRVLAVDRFVGVTREMISKDASGDEQLILIREILVSERELLGRRVSVLKAHGFDVSDHEQSLKELDEIIPGLPEPAVPQERRRRVVLPSSGNASLSFWRWVSRKMK